MATSKARTDNTTDATRGQPLGERVLARKAELEEALASLDAGQSPTRTALETALATAVELTTGDVEHPSEAVGQSMNKWLENNKHLAGGDIAHQTQTMEKVETLDMPKVETDAQGQAQSPGAELTTDDATSRAAERPVEVTSLNDGDAKGSGPAGEEDRVEQIPSDAVRYGS